VSALTFVFYFLCTCEFDFCESLFLFHRSPCPEEYTSN